MDAGEIRIEITDDQCELVFLNKWAWRWDFAAAVLRQATIEELSTSPLEPGAWRCPCRVARARGKSLQPEAAAAQAAPALMLTGTLDLVAFISIAASSISQQKLELQRSLPQFKAGPRKH